MRIYFSGGAGLTFTPEVLIPQHKPHVMLTFHEIDRSGVLDRLNVYLERKYKIIQRKGKEAVPPSTKTDRPLWSDSIFMDSGAYSLYGLHVGESKDRVGEHGRKLDRIRRKRWGAGDYSFYSLAPGAEFRKYCDKYARFMQRLKHTDVLFTTVDAIYNPIISWHIQEYFEKEHGLRPIPVVHGGTPHGTRWLQRYVDAGHKMIGFGGLGQTMRVNTYRPWANEMWRLICPESNGYKPLVRVHGFAMTSWSFMSEWPWWSVDSASWAKLSAYGWIMVPPWDAETKRFRFDVPPLQINISRIPTERKQRFWWRVKCKTPRQQKDRHYDNAPKLMKEGVDRWLEHLGVSMGEFSGEFVPEQNSFGVHGSIDPDNFEVAERGATSDFRSRLVVNLNYFGHFQANLPPWPLPLRKEIVEEKQKIKYRHGFGL